MCSLILLFFLNLATFLKLQEEGRLHLCCVLFSLDEIYYVENPYVSEIIPFNFCLCV